MKESKYNKPTGKENAAATLEGWLAKQGNYIKNWRKRWFQVMPGMLNYYKDPTSEHEPTNFFILAGSKCQPSEKNENIFELVMANGEKRYMQANSKAERDKWISAITMASQVARVSSDLESPSESHKKMSPNDFNFFKVLGKGNYGKVMLATLKGKSNEYYAVKIIKKSCLIDEESLEHVLSENRVLQTMDHPFLVKLYSSFQTIDRLYFVMEYVRGGELFFHLGRDKKFNEERAKFYAAEIVVALQYLHSKGIVYRDLKLENLLIDESGHIKITDFGLCKEGIGTTADRTSTFCGTPEYLAPEILEEENYGKSVDWWALGVVLYEMLIGRPPFGPAQNMEQLFHSILHQRIVIPFNLSADARSLLESLLRRDPSQRIGCGISDGEEIMKHSFFKNINFQALMRKEITPPYVPKLLNALDTQNFDSEFTDLPPVLTPIDSSQFKNAIINDKSSTAFNVNGFTFFGESVLKDTR